MLSWMHCLVMRDPGVPLPDWLLDEIGGSLSAAKKKRLSIMAPIVLTEQTIPVDRIDVL
jgi:hypothetical protein